MDKDCASLSGSATSLFEDDQREFGGAPLFESLEARRRFLAGILDWIEARLDRFVPPIAAERDDKDEEARKVHKAFLELGLAVHLAGKCPQFGLAPNVKRITDWWVEVARSRPGLFQPCGRDWLFPNAVVGLGLWNMMASAPRSLIQDLQTMLDRGYLDRDENEPWLRLELAHYLDRLKLRHRIGPSEPLLATSIVAQLPNLCFMQRTSAYKITHILFFLSDFGRHRIDPQVPIDRATLGPYLELLLATQLADEDWDLVSEVLMCRLALGIGRTPLDAEAVRRLCRAQRPPGNIPNRLAEDERGGAPPDAAADEFDQVYHQTLVALLLACAEQSC